MYAKYDFRKKPSSKEDEDKQPLYPRIVSNGTIDFKRIVKEIARLPVLPRQTSKEFSWRLKIKYLNI